MGQPSTKPDELTAQQVEKYFGDCRINQLRKKTQKNNEGRKILKYDDYFGHILIHDSYFKDYIRQYAKDSDEAHTNYSSANFDGVIYWYLS